MNLLNIEFVNDEISDTVGILVFREVFGFLIVRDGDCMLDVLN